MVFVKGFLCAEISDTLFKHGFRVEFVITLMTIKSCTVGSCAWTRRRLLMWPSGVLFSDMLKETGVRGWILVAILEEMQDLKEMASFESWAVKCEAPALWMKVARCILWKVEEQCRERGACLAVNFWIMCESTRSYKG